MIIVDCYNSYNQTANIIQITIPDNKTAKKLSLPQTQRD